METKTKDQTNDPAETAVNTSHEQSAETPQGQGNDCTPDTRDCTKTKVTETDVIEAIVSIESQTVKLAGKPHTVTAALLANGFTIIETSTAVDPNNFDEKIGEEVNTKKIHAKVWPLLGYALQQKLHDAKSPATKAAALVSVRDLLVSAMGSGQLSDDAIDDAVLMIDNVISSKESSQCFQQRAITEKEALSDKVAKLEAFSSGELFDELDPAERTRLASQLKAMKSYERVLSARIANFQKEV